MNLTDIKGIGTTRAKSFEDVGILSCEDLINYFPNKYYDFSKTEPYSDDGKVRLIKTTVTENAKIVKIRGNFSFVTCKVIDEHGHIFNAVWYNQTYIKSALYIGLDIYLYGKNSPTKKNTFIVNISKTADKLDKLGLLPVYKSIDSIGQKTLHDSINYSIQSLEISSVITNNLLYKYNLINLKDAYQIIHNPDSFDLLEKAKNRIQIESLIPLIAINDYHRFMYKTIKKQSYKNIINLISEYENILPFKLTTDQKQAIKDIEHDMSSKYTMNRLLQGDVGSGKTLVSFFGAFLAAKSGYQSAIVAPTEILANQHYKNAKSLFEKQGINVVLLTSSVKGFEKQTLINDIENGSAQIIIGTHSVISENVKYNNLSYIVIDEQHRFGVEQRAKLKEKGISPDILVMSATPIPRTLGLVVFGDLDISYLNSRPKPQHIQTNIVIKSKQEDMWNFLKGKIKDGSKAYVVCSKIDESNDDESVINYSANNMYKMLLSKFEKSEIALIHGKVSKDTQNDIIEKFKKGIIKVLVSTTIIEVGVDIPDADYMVIATPERFGLATLHQLRGRIGRDGSLAYCFCLADNLNEKSIDRITFFKNHTNGFEIADYDQKTRGIGSIVGTNQHGNDNGLLNMLTSENYKLAKEILEHLKLDTRLHNEILEKGESLYTQNILGKIILN